MQNIVKIMKTAYKLFHPFIGLVSWKKRAPASALYHSLSVAVMAGDIADLLAEGDTDEVNLATYGGLVHDFYSKTPNISPNLTKEVSKKIVCEVLSREGLSEDLIKEVLELANYNVAENPYYWGVKHPIASLSIRLADIMTSTSSASKIRDMLLCQRKKLAKKLDDEQRKPLEDLRVDVITLAMPQIALRSMIYEAIIDDLKSLESYGDIPKFIPILANGGLVIMYRNPNDLKEIFIDIDNILNHFKEKYIKIEDICNGVDKESRESCRRRLSPLEGPNIGNVLCDEAFKGLIFATPGIKLNISIGKCRRETKFKCMFCGLPVHDKHLHPSTVGYILYRRAVVERWSPRLPAISYGGKNLNKLMSDQSRYWDKFGVVACPLCVFDAIVVRQEMIDDELQSSNYFIQSYFTFPTHYYLAQYMVFIARKLLSNNSWRPKDIANWKELRCSINSIIDEYSSSGKKTWLLDVTWSVHLKVVESEETGEVKQFAYYLPLMAEAILLTGIYPLKFTRKPDFQVEDRLIMPIYPLYDYSLTEEGLKMRTPLIVMALSIIDELDGENLSQKDRVITTIKYMRYPFELHEDLLTKHKAGRQVLKMYKEFIEYPEKLYSDSLE